MHLRKITTAKDIELLKSFFYEVFPEESGYDLSHIKNSVAGTHHYKRLEYYLGYENNTAVGISGIYAANEDECWLGWFGIRPEHRRQGYASALLDLQLQMMKNCGYKICRLYTNEIINKNAVYLYLKKGFQKDSSYGKNIITMAKSLDKSSTIHKWRGRPLGFVPEWQI